MDVLGDVLVVIIIGVIIAVNIFAFLAFLYGAFGFETTFAYLFVENKMYFE